MNNPKVSVIVPVYNSEKHIIKCIESIIEQTFTDFECVLVDDCSTDKCPEICDDFALKDSKIKVIHNEYNTGASLSRKIGLDASIGEYILYIDSDDYIEKNMIEKMYKTTALENFDLLMCAHYFIKGDDTKIIQNRISNINEKESIIKDLISYRIKNCLWDRLVKKDLYLKVVYPKYTYQEDFVINIQILLNAKKIGYIDIPLYHHVYNDNSYTNNADNELRCVMEQNKNFQIIIAFLKEKYSKNLKMFEPELSSRVNGMKYKYMKNKELRFKRDLFKLYPESKFWRKYFLSLIKKTIKLILGKETVRRIRHLFH